MDPPPSSILILGHGVFGLSIALSLSLRPAFANTVITLLDRSPFPSPDGSSIDTSRIIRSDYSDPSYAKLGSEAMTIWRSSSTSPLPAFSHGKVANILSGLGEEGRYTQSGLALLCNNNQQGSYYVRQSYKNMKSMSSSQGVHELKNRREIDEAVKTGGGDGDWGYVNASSGWADAEASMRFLYEKVKSLNRVKFVTGEAVSLVHSRPASSSSSTSPKPAIKGVLLSTGQQILADLTILATGAWSGSLLDLRGRATATGQILCYLPLSPSQQETLSKMPVVLNMSTGMFIIPPAPPSAKYPERNLLKVARHGYGYTNPVSIPGSRFTFSTPKEQEGKGKEEKIVVSLPRTIHNDPNIHVPLEGQSACLEFLTQLIPSLSPSTSSTSTPSKHISPFTHSKICWYNDTSTGDFLICHHPSYTGLFIATGGSGHGFKFLPVIGERIVDVMLKEGKGWEEFGLGVDGKGEGKWGWREAVGENEVVTEDGSRGGGKGMVLDEELRKGRERVGSKL